jgi:hypothetical protein
MYQRGTRWTDLHQFDVGTSMKICRENPNLVKIAQKYWELYT